MTGVGSGSGLPTHTTVMPTQVGTQTSFDTTAVAERSARTAARMR